MRKKWKKEILKLKQLHLYILINKYEQKTKTIHKLYG